MNFKNKAFTLIEIMVGILIVAIVIVSGFEAYIKIGIGKISLMEKTNIQKDSFYFSEKLFQIIKEGGTLDYEEYFNRKVIGTNFGSGHYSLISGFGNFGSGGTINTSTYGSAFYQCLSGNGIANALGTSGCYNNNKNIYGASVIGKQQRYGQYSYQFIDYNSNFDDDGGDENGDLKIVGDDDDEFLGDGPEAFTGGVDVKELYLISGDKKTRTFIRWNVNVDPNKPPSATCSINTSNIITGSGCIGTVEFLKLEGVDWGMDHDSAVQDSTQNDGLIDTWLIDKQFTGKTNANTLNSVIAGSNLINYWRPLFPTGINVTEFKIYPYPSVESKYFWKSSLASKNISPYVIMNLKIKPSWETRKKLKNEGKEINFNTTINLTDIYSK